MVLIRSKKQLLAQEFLLPRQYFHGHRWSWRLMLTKHQKVPWKVELLHNSVLQQSNPLTSWDLHWFGFIDKNCLVSSMSQSIKKMPSLLGILHIYWFFSEAKSSIKMFSFCIVNKNLSCFFLHSVFCITMAQNRN
jgi:hypothetical protein